MQLLLFSGFAIRRGWRSCAAGLLTTRSGIRGEKGRGKAGPEGRGEGRDGTGWGGRGRATTRSGDAVYCTSARRGDAARRGEWECSCGWKAGLIRKQILTSSPMASALLLAASLVFAKAKLASCVMPPGRQTTAAASTQEISLGRPPQTKPSATPKTSSHFEFACWLHLDFGSCQQQRSSRRR